MKIVNRYILREMLVPLAYCLVGFNMIFVIFDLFDNLSHLMDGRLSPLRLTGYYLAYISAYLQWIMPAALLLATLYTMWRFAHNGEITAMRASGIGFRSIAAPMFWVSMVMALMLALLNEFIAPSAGEWAKRMSRNRFHPLPPQVFETVPFFNHAERRIWFIDRLDARTPHRLEGVRITFEREDRSREREVVASRAEFLDGEWLFFDPVFTAFDKRNEVIPGGQAALNRPVMRMPSLNERPQDFLTEFKDWQYFSLREIYRYLNMHPGLPEQARAEKWYQLHFRLASPWSAVVITLFAIPAGVASGRQSVSRGVLLAIGFFFGFFALSHLCQFVGQRGLIPPLLGAWMPNLVFSVAGLLLYHKQG